MAGLASETLREIEMAKAAVPVVIEEEAARRIARLQNQREVESMLDWVRENVSGLRGVRIVDHDAPSGSERILMWAHEAGPLWKSVSDSPDYRLIIWKCFCFPAEVGRQVSMWTTHLPMPDTRCR